MDITNEELVAEMNRMFNKELTICLQKLQIAKLQQMLNDKQGEEE
tara:strand:+ start:580 stop:714 length:135 start_codon:yes stop_codon:yes gene_type:complete